MRAKPGLYMFLAPFALGSRSLRKAAATWVRTVTIGSTMRDANRRDRR